MSVLVGGWVLGICVILIWCSLQMPDGEGLSGGQEKRAGAHLEYIPISLTLLRKWAGRDDRLLIFDLRPPTDAGSDSNSVPGSLRIPPEHLMSYFCYLPPNTRLVLYGKTPVTPLDRKAENVLLMADIQTVYILEGTTCKSVDSRKMGVICAEKVRLGGHQETYCDHRATTPAHHLSALGHPAVPKG